MGRILGFAVLAGAEVGAAAGVPQASASNSPSAMAGMPSRRRDLRDVSMRLLRRDWSDEARSRAPRN